MRTRRTRTILAALGVALAGLAALLGVEQLPAAEIGAVSVSSHAVPDGTLHITERTTGGGQVSGLAIGGFLVGAGLVAFAAWPTRRILRPLPPTDGTHRTARED